MQNKPKKIFMVCGARPNFMKIAPVWKEMKKYPDVFEPVIVHTGQHYDKNMSGQFFSDLGLMAPDVHLGVGPDTQARQIAKIMTGFEDLLTVNRPDMVMVVGDVNSTLACSLVASRMMIPVAHVEAGLRSFDRTMPEEINRILTDHLSDILFTTCRDGDKNLEKEGVAPEKIFFAGNVMIDTLIDLKDKITLSRMLDKVGVEPGKFAVLTLHRPSNVDDPGVLKHLFGAFSEIAGRISLIFPAHPRTLKNLKTFDIKFDKKKIRITEPMGYLDFMSLYANAAFVMTDSGGIQEETTYMGIPCLTLRENTERPVTITEGTNILTGINADNIIKEAAKILDGQIKKGRVPEKWDGRSAERIAGILSALLQR